MNSTLGLSEIPLLLLMAGHSARMLEPATGEICPKGLLPWHDGRYWAQEQMDRFLGAGGREVILVLGAHQTRYRTHLWPRCHPSIKFVVNDHFELGQLSSVLCALQALTHAPPGAFLGLIDTPLPPAASPLWSLMVRHLAAAPLQTPTVIIPKQQELAKRGHPILLNRRLIERLQVLPLAATARLDQILKTDGVTRMEVETNEPDIATNFNTWAQWEEWQTVAMRTHEKGPSLR